MKKHLVLVLVLTALSASPAFSQISVSGSAEVKVVPDEIYLRVGVESRNSNLEEARKLNDDSVSKALTFLKSKEIDRKNIQTDFISVQPEYNSSSWSTVSTYIVRKSIEVKLTNTESFESILTGLLNNGVNTVQGGVEFRTSQLRKYRDQARAMAIRAAREKADTMAAELGVKLGKVGSINANDSGGWWNFYGGYWGAGLGANAFQNVSQNAGGGAPESDESTLSLGQISVSASVNVTFSIE